MATTPYRPEQEGGGLPNTEWKKYHKYEVNVDSSQDDRAIELNFCDTSRPHMRAFHFAWWSFFIAFFNWFAIIPLLNDIQNDLKLTNYDIWVSSLGSLGSTILVRFLLGPLCENYGPRIMFSILLCLTAIPTACVGFIQTSTDLILLRMFIGFTGGSFVICEYWSSIMFADQLVGTANALTAGWGNLGAGVTHLMIGSVLFPFFTTCFDGNTERAWRTVCIVPAAIAFITGVAIYYYTDDCPKGNYKELKKHGSTSNRNDYMSLSKQFSLGLWNKNTCILFIQYACCFGVELTMNTVAASYFKAEFDQSTQVSVSIVSIFGWMNMFARGFGGFLCDAVNFRYGLRGKLGVHMVLLASEGILIMLLGQADTLARAIAVMVFFSFFLQAAEGSTYSIVPLVNPQTKGAIIGIVGAGGNVGAVCFNFLFQQIDHHDALRIMGGCIIISAVLCFCIRIDGQSHLLTRNSNIDDDSNERKRNIKEELKQDMNAVVSFALISELEELTNRSSTGGR